MQHMNEHQPSEILAGLPARISDVGRAGAGSSGSDGGQWHLDLWGASFPNRRDSSMATRLGLPTRRSSNDRVPKVSSFGCASVGLAGLDA